MSVAQRIGTRALYGEAWFHPSYFMAVYSQEVALTSCGGFLVCPPHYDYDISFLPFLCFLMMSDDECFSMCPLATWIVNFICLLLQTSDHKLVALANIHVFSV